MELLTGRMMLQIIEDSTIDRGEDEYFVLYATELCIPSVDGSKVETLQRRISTIRPRCNREFAAP